MRSIAADAGLAGLLARHGAFREWNDVTQGLVHIAVGVLSDAAGTILISRRPDDVHQGGLWEFPGGKLEPGETAFAALRRELNEELGIEITSGKRFLQTTHEYPDRTVLLDVWRVDDWCGRVHGREGQPLAWVSTAELDKYAFPAADLPILRALRLPNIYLITPDSTGDAEFFGRLEALLSGGVRLVQLRARQMAEDQFRLLAASVLRLCETYDARLILNTSPATARAVGAHGVHLTSARLLQLQVRPLPPDMLVAASCHNEMELDHAAAIGADFALISPVFPTTSHPDATPLGWDGFQALAARAQHPVYALGGLHPLDMPAAYRNGAHGIALISGLWDADNPQRAAQASISRESGLDTSPVQQ